MGNADDSAAAPTAMEPETNEQIKIQQLFGLVFLMSGGLEKLT